MQAITGGPQGEVQPGEQLLKSALEAWQGPSLVITGDQDPTVPAQVRLGWTPCLVTPLSLLSAYHLMPS